MALTESTNFEELVLIREMIIRRPDSGADHPMIRRIGNMLRKLEKKMKARTRRNDRQEKQ